jgi:hypothetical protein
VNLLKVYEPRAPPIQTMPTTRAPKNGQDDIMSPDECSSKLPNKDARTKGGEQ